jgi:hypothetical protein
MVVQFTHQLLRDVNLMIESGQEIDRIDQDEIVEG